jgi:hypothetical protein
MEKITELTQANRDAMPKYVDKWIAIGTNTDRLDPDRTVEIIHDYQKHILNVAETPVIILDNPNECWIACNYAMMDVPVDEIKERVKNYFTVEKDIEVDTPVYPYQDGSFFASVLSFYDYMFNELKIELEPDLRKKYDIWERTSELGMIYPLENVCFVSQKPTVIKLNEEKQLHCDGGPAFEYAGYGDFKIYSLNGVRVSEYLAVTPEEQLDIQKFHDITNADEKTEFVRKFGVDRMLGLGKKIDSFEKYDKEWWNKSEYELWDMKEIFAGVNYAPHLKMTNQSTGVYHVEAVSPRCRTLADAIKERLGGNDLEIVAIA